MMSMKTIKVSPAPFRTFGPTFEKEFGPSLAAELEKLSSVGARERLAAARLTEELRVAYGSYFPSGQAHSTQQDSQILFAAQLEHLSEDRIAYYLELVGLAVHVEMKHLENPGYAADPDHTYELLSERTEHEDAESLTEANSERWAELADNAMAHALAENC